MKTDTPFDDLLTDDELCRERGITPRTSQRERAQRIGPPYIKIGRKIYYRKEAVRDWLLSQEQIPVAAE